MIGRVAAKASIVIIALSMFGFFVLTFSVDVFEIQIVLGMLLLAFALGGLWYELR